MSGTSTSEFVDLLRRFRLVDAVQLAEATHDSPGGAASPAALADDLLRRGWLTPFQMDKIISGNAADLLLGSYVLLDWLGEGGMGTVFKARNWKFGRVVALKLIRKERLDNPEVVRRFRREIRAAAHLDHPNIVRALDADEVNGTHLLVMEFIQGVDLAKRVKEDGPLSVAEACDYARQAALGLQHAHERGLVHRDIKPHNLLVTPDAIVKILDMGLARVSRQPGDGASTETGTGQGVVIGTPDYIAPEQAWESRDVDIRADLYSLGCTLYHLLAGRPPFPDGNLLQKLHKHQYEEPTPVEVLRPDVPPGVAAVVGRLMAKRPEDRFQTPAEAAFALATACSRASDSPPSRATAAAAPAGRDKSWSELFGAPDSPTLSAPAAPRRQARPSLSFRNLRPYLIGTAASLLLLIGGAWLMVALVPAAPKPAATLTAPATGPPVSQADPIRLRAAFQGPDAVELTWDEFPGLSNGFRVERATDPYFKQNLLAMNVPGGDMRSFMDVKRAPGAVYYYRVWALRASGEAGVSNTAWPPPDFPEGFPTAGLALNGGAAVINRALRLTDQHPDEARSAFYRQEVDVRSFHTWFRFCIDPGTGTADGFTFCIQGGEPTAVGGGGGGLGYQAVPRSVAVKFDLWNDDGEGVNSTGLFRNGDKPSNPGAIDLTPTGIDLHSGSAYDAVIDYKDGKLTLTILDADDPSKKFTKTFDVDVPATVGGSTALAGFTGGTGAAGAVQDILSWTWQSNTPAD